VHAFAEQVIEGKTPEITLEQAPLIRSVDIGRVVGLWDRAILATLAYTVCRARAVAKFRLGDFQHTGRNTCCGSRRRGARAGKSRCGMIWKAIFRMYVHTTGITGETKDRPLFRSTQGTTKRLTDRPLTTKDVCRMVKRRLKDAGPPVRLSPHSFQVTGITDLLSHGAPLEHAQAIANDESPKTTKLYDRRE
jgi:integrase